MNTSISSTDFGVEQVCLVVEISRPELIQVIELGIVEPPGDAPENWVFDSHMLSVLRRATRLHRQLEVSWPGIALAMQLLEEVEQLQTENQRLRQRLQRFIR
jgi:chaperone modulatory protein CbpM